MIFSSLSGIFSFWHTFSPLAFFLSFFLSFSLSFFFFLSFFLSFFCLYFFFILRVYLCYCLRFRVCWIFLCPSVSQLRGNLPFEKQTYEFEPFQGDFHLNSMKSGKYELFFLDGKSSVRRRKTFIRFCAKLFNEITKLFNEIVCRASKIFLRD